MNCFELFEKIFGGRRLAGSFQFRKQGVGDQVEEGRKRRVSTVFGILFSAFGYFGEKGYDFFSSYGENVLAWVSFFWFFQYELVIGLLEKQYTSATSLPNTLINPAD